MAFLRFNRSIYHDPAFRILEVVVSIFNDYDFPFNEDRSVIPNQDDQSTLFVCSGMQRFKSRFTAQDKGRLSSLQSCIRTNDIDLVGDGSHLTHFQMLGNFSFGNNDYEKSCEMWRSIDQQILLGISNIHVHPSSPHKLIWEKMGYPTIEDVDCVWSDGTIGGYCSEMYRGNLEIGNLVNTLGHSTDVGFGWERMIQICEQKSRVDETSLFSQHLPPIVRDHERTIELLIDNGVVPGNKGREYVLRRLLRRVLQHDVNGFSFDPLLDRERERRHELFSVARKRINRHGQRSDQFWWETFGILPEERRLL